MPTPANIRPTFPHPATGARPLPGSSSEQLPEVILDARIGRGTVRSEIDRSIRFRLEGDGPASTRTFVPDSRAAVELLRQPNGHRLPEALSRMVSVADDFNGRDDLRTITLVPDEHAVKATELLSHLGRYKERYSNWDYSEQASGPPQAYVNKFSQRIPGWVAFSNAWNTAGDITFMPHASRDMLASLGLYRMQPGDDTQLSRVADRPWYGRKVWQTGIHETHHSITPNGHGPGWENALEEAVAVVLPPLQQQPIIRATGAQPELLAQPARHSTSMAVDWKPWNAKHLPKPPASLADTAQRNYTDAPRLVNQLIGLAGIDRRTRAGRASTIDLLQRHHVSRVPNRLANAIGDRHGLDHGQRLTVARMIRDATVGTASFGDIERFVTSAQ